MLTRSGKTFDRTAIALAVICGVGSLIFFVGYPLGSLAILRLPWSQRWLLCLDGLLSFAFFLQHSGMNRRRFRAWLSTRLAPRYHGALYSIASGAALVLVVTLWQSSATQLVVLHGLARWLAQAIGVMAMGIFIWSTLALLTFDPLGLEPIKAHLRGRPQAPPRFVVRGPYRWVRHPLYFASIVMIWAWPDITADRLLFNVLWTIWIWVGAHLEERDLESDFDADYRDYCTRVPMLIPWRGPATPQWVPIKASE